MTNTLKYALLFLGGLALGGAGGYVSAKMVLEKHYNQKFEDAVSDMEEYFQTKDEYSRSDQVFDDDAEVNPSPENLDRSQGVLSEDARAEIKEKLMKNYETTSERASAYANAYKDAHPESLEGGDDISSELLREGDDESDEDMDPALKATLEHQEHKNDPPRIITSDEFDALPPHIDTQTLYFYHDDETVIDDNDDIIEDPALLVGNTLSDFIDDINNPMMFVYNPALDTAYEIQRVEGAYYNG